MIWRTLAVGSTTCWPVFSDIPELLRLPRTLDSWQPELLAYFTTGGIGPTEAVNLLIKRIKRVGFGFRNFENYRRRLLLHLPPPQFEDGYHG